MEAPSESKKERKERLKREKRERKEKEKEEKMKLKEKKKQEKQELKLKKKREKEERKELKRIEKDRERRVRGQTISRVKGEKRSASHDTSLNSSLGGKEALATKAQSAVAAPTTVARKTEKNESDVPSRKSESDDKLEVTAAEHASGQRQEDEGDRSKEKEQEPKEKDDEEKGSPRVAAEDPPEREKPSSSNANAGPSSETGSGDEGAQAECLLDSEHQKHTSAQQDEEDEKLGLLAAKITEDREQQEQQKSTQVQREQEERERQLEEERRLAQAEADRKRQEQEEEEQRRRAQKEGEKQRRRAEIEHRQREKEEAERKKLEQQLRPHQSDVDAALQELQLIEKEILGISDTTDDHSAKAHRAAEEQQRQEERERELRQQEEEQERQKSTQAQREQEERERQLEEERRLAQAEADRKRQEQEEEEQRRRAQKEEEEQRRKAEAERQRQAEELAQQQRLAMESKAKREAGEQARIEELETLKEEQARAQTPGVEADAPVAETVAEHKEDVRSVDQPATITDSKLELELERSCKEEEGQSNALKAVPVASSENGTNSTRDKRKTFAGGSSKKQTAFPALPLEAPAAIPASNPERRRANTTVAPGKGGVAARWQQAIDANLNAKNQNLTDQADDRVVKGVQWMGTQIRALISEIQRLGEINDGKPRVTFGALFAATIDTMPALAAAIATAKKRGVVQYEGDMLLQGVHDNVEITLLKDTIADSATDPSPRRRGNTLSSGHSRSEPVLSHNERCVACGKTAYPLERAVASGKVFHKTCFKCSVCKCVLKVIDYAHLDGTFFCQTHFQQLFLMNGDYKAGFNKAAESASTAL